LGPKKIKKIKILKIKIRVAQNVGKVWISRKKNLPAPFGAFPGHFLRGPENPKNVKILTIFLGGPLAPILPLKRPGPIAMHICHIYQDLSDWLCMVVLEFLAG